MLLPYSLTTKFYALGIITSSQNWSNRVIESFKESKRIRFQEEITYVFYNFFLCFSFLFFIL